MRRYRWRTGLGMAALAAATAAVGVQLVGGAGPAVATAGFTFTRVAGADRYQTAAQVAEDAYSGGTKAVILANGTLGHFPDALAASYLAGYLNIPVLLTDVNSLSSGASRALQALHVQAVAVVGGPAAVSDSVVSQLTAAGYRVNRVAGATRYDTDAAVAAIPPASHVGTAGGVLPTAIVASGTNFPDALVSGPMAFASGLPIVITDPASLSSQAQATLQGLGIRQVLIPGGTAAVSSNVATQLTAMGIAVTRFAGADRTDTAAQVAAYEVKTLGFTNSAVGLARGDDPADSLAGGPFGGLFKTPIILTDNPSTLGSYSLAFLKGEAATLQTGVVFGGPAAVSDAVLAQAEAAARSVVNSLVSLVATPNQLVAGPVSGAGQVNTATLTATVTGANGQPVANDPVTFSSIGAPSTACGVITPPAGVTNAAGQATATYTSAAVGGTCSVAVSEQDQGGTAQAPITETSASGITVAVSVNPAQVAGGSTTTAQVVATVSKNGAPVANDPVVFSSTPASVCGALVPAGAATASNGQLAATYAPGLQAGVCVISATEAQGQASGSAEIAQTSSSTSTTLPGGVTTTSVTLPPVSSTTLPGGVTTTSLPLATTTTLAGVTTTMLPPTTTTILTPTCVTTVLGGACLP